MSKTNTIRHEVYGVVTLTIHTNTKADHGDAWDELAELHALGWRDLGERSVDPRVGAFKATLYWPEGTEPQLPIGMDQNLFKVELNPT